MRVAVVGLGMAGSTLACLLAMKVPVVRSQVVTTLTGDRTSPWSTWPLPEAP